MYFIFEQIKTGGDRNFGYLIGDGKSKTAALVDPSYSPEVLVERAKVQGLNIEYIINTHSHGDHTNGNEKANELTGGKIAAFEDSSIRPDVPLKDKQQIKLGNLVLVFYHTPGHCSDHVVIEIPEYRILITGDHLFVGKIGGTGNKENAKQQFDSLWKLYELVPEETTVWPGHDVGCRPSSTLAIERASNPFLLEDFEAFCNIKENWPTFKVENGLL
jgi:glyoxylase-like metal-dependent hydrolase (beta-lactamase superfamily II)